MRSTKPISDCYGCLGTGYVVGFGYRNKGTLCPCLDRNACSECGDDSGVEREEPGAYVLCDVCEWFDVLDGLHGVESLSLDSAEDMLQLARLLALRIGRIES